MTLQYKTLLITSCISFSLQAMEQNIPTLTSSLIEMETDTQRYPLVNDLYRKAYNTLAYYNPKEIQSIVALSEIIIKTKELETYDIKEKNIGQFAYTQEESFKDKVLAYTKPPYNNPFYVSVFFERIRAYNNNLQKNKFISPNLQQFNQYLENKDTDLATDIAANFGIYLEKEKLLHDIPLNIATKEFEKLLHDIVIMQTTEPELIQKIAYRIYSLFNKKTQ